MEYTADILDHVSKEDEQKIYSELLKYNLEHLEGREPKDLGIFIRDKEQRIQAGLTGYTHGNWLIIKYLWVQDCLRGMGVGSELLKKAEEEAARRQCRYAFVDTFSFQAPGFYIKHGYQERFVLENYPIKGKRFYYTKELRKS